MCVCLLKNSSFTSYIARHTLGIWWKGGKFRHRLWRQMCASPSSRSPLSSFVGRKRREKVFPPPPILLTQMMPNFLIFSPPPIRPPLLGSRLSPRGERAPREENEERRRPASIPLPEKRRGRGGGRRGSPRLSDLFPTTSSPYYVRSALQTSH